jgi:predicted ester cyclase
MDNKETYAFAESLMRQVWEPLDSTHVPEFYHQDVVGHHRLQEMSYDDVVNRLDWDRQTFSKPVYDIRDIIAAEDKFAIRFLYTATITATGEEAKAETWYVYHLRDGKVAEFWLLADIDFDYKQKPK